MGDHATHGTEAIHRWPLAHPRFHVRCTPTCSSRLNLVERFFAELTTKQLRRGVRRSVEELERAIADWIEAWNEAWNEHPRPFVWVKTADEILDRVATYCRRISDSGH